jgi:nucleoside-diphosphate-sugar epimerase
VPELIGAGHQVVGLSRSEAGAEALVRAGAEVVRGDVNDLPRLRSAAEAADAIIHAAFNHDFSNHRQHSEEDRKVVEALGQALAGSDRPLIVTSGTGLARSKTGAPVVETDEPASSTDTPRGATEDAAAALTSRGVRAMVMRLPQVHDTRRHGRITLHIQLARQKRRVAYIGAGLNRLPGAHVTDVVRLYRLALESGLAGARYHAVAEDGVAMCDIAEAIGARLKLPVGSITPEAAVDYFGGLVGLAAMDLAASGAWTCEQLGWIPTGPDLLSDLRNLDDSAASSH